MLPNPNPNNNIETRISNRAKSIFAAFGQVINDFYIEAGIYFVGGFNAALVAWDIYTELSAEGQPLAYVVSIAIIAFIAVEGLAVYLVGAAAKTNNGLLWFFSVVFAGFFTYAHYQEMVTHAGAISQYMMLAIPFFVVVGYWARTVKIDIERLDQKRDEIEVAAKETAQLKRDFQLEQARLNAEQKRREAKETAQAERDFQIEQARIIARQEEQAAEQKHAEKLARIEAKKVSQSVSSTVSEVSRQLSQEKTLEMLKTEIIDELGQEKPNMTQLAQRLDIARGTLYRHLVTLNETGHIVKNGKGYELPDNS